MREVAKKEMNKPHRCPGKHTTCEKINASLKEILENIYKKYKAE